MSSENNTSHDESSPSEVAIPRIIRFWITLLFYIPSLSCTLFALSHFIFDRALRRALYNHIIILLLLINLITQLTNIPWTLNYYRLGYVSSPTPAFCLTWVFTDEGLYITTTLLFSWATIERHILIFHDRLMRIKYKRILLHYLPIVIILVYCLCYNTIVLLFPSCENTFDYSEMVCGNPLCYYETHLVATWEVIVNDFIPTIIIIVCSIALLVRTLRQKHRMRQRIRWRNHRKMTIQLLSISLLYLVIYIPEMVMEFVYLCGVPEDVGADFMMYAESFTHFGNLLLPFVCAGSLPDLQKKVKGMFPCWRRGMRTVGPQTMTVARRLELPAVRMNAFD